LIEAVAEEDMTDTTTGGGGLGEQKPMSSMDRMAQYMDACRPDEDETDNAKSWLATQVFFSLLFPDNS
jgi:hypothetical protein